jgi:hypothetical protein
MAKFENMTLSYIQIASIPFKTRKSASGSLLDVLSRELTPGQRVALFPSYVNQIYSSGRAYKEKRNAPELFDPSSGEVAAPFSPANIEPVGRPTPQKTTTTPNIIPARLIPDPVTGKPMRVPDQKLISNTKTTALLNLISKAEGTPSYDTQFGYQDIARQKAGGKPLTQMTINEVRQLMSNTPKDKRAMGRYQFVPGTFDDVVRQMGLTGNEIFSPEMQDKMIIHRLNTTRGMDRWMNGTMTDEDFMHSLAQEFASLPSPKNNGNSLYGGVGLNKSKPSISLSELSSNLSQIKTMPEEDVTVTSEVDSVYDLPEEATAEPIKVFSSVPYDDLRSEYPDIIDEDSTFWDKIDPSLKDNKSMIVDLNGRKVGRETLIAADAAAKVLRKNGLTPRIVSGGDEHSKNHGRGTSVNRSIDIQAYDADGNNVHLGQVDPQVRKDMLTASQLSVKGENFRIGVPTDASNTGMHIQSDPNFKPAIWGYSEGQPYSRETLRNNNPEYIQLWEQNQKLDEEERQKTLQALVGPFEGIPSENQQAADVSAPTVEPVETTSDQYVNVQVPYGDLEYTPEGKPIDPDTGFLMKKTDPRYPNTNTAALGTGYNAAAGGAEITDPSMIISEDGKKVTRVAETGPEKISVMPRHKSSDVFQENQIMMQEMIDQKAKEEMRKPDIAEMKSNPRFSDFGRSRETGQSIQISTNMPKVSLSAGKAFADAKMVSRFNKADVEGDMGIVYIDRGYA